MRAAVFLLAAVWAIPIPAAGLRAGKAAVKIAAPAGAPIAGARTPRTSNGVLDELYIKAIAIEAGDKKAVLISCDLYSLDTPTAAAARRAVTEATGLQPEQIMISATQTHSGPADAAVRALLPGRIAEAAAQAIRSLSPVSVSRAVGKEDSICHYRRYLMKDGTAQTDPGKRNPETVQPMGEADPDLAVVHFDPAAIYVNYAMLPASVRGSRYSADYPAPLARLLGKVFGNSTLAVFTLGAAANVGHIDVKSNVPQKGPAEASRIGTVLAGEAIKVSARLEPLEAGDLRFVRETVRLAGRSKPAGEIEAEVQVIALGDQIAWVALPGQVFVELGRAVKKASPFPLTIVVTAANGDIGIVPSAKAYKEGGEDVAASLLAPGAGEALAETAIRLLAKAHRAAR